MVAARSGYVKGGVPVRTPLFLCAFFFPALSIPAVSAPTPFRPGTFCPGIFCPGAFCPGAFRPGTFPPRLFVLLRPFCPACLPPPPGGCSSEREGARQGGRSLGRYGKGRRSVGRREGPVGRGEARSSEKGRPFGRKEPRQVRGGSVGGADTRLPEVPCGVHFRRKGCLRSRIGGPNDTNRIKNTRFGLPFNEKFGMFVHMNRIRLAEVTLIGHATGSLSGTCAGRGTGGENIWCFMSPAR